MTRKYGFSSRESGYKLKQPAWRDKQKPVTRVESDACETVKQKPQEYTGTLVKGVALMHKSCYQPVISDEEIIDAARMRR